MKKFLVLGFGLALMFLTGCERKQTADVNSNGPGGNQTVTLQLWTTTQDRFFDSLAREFVGEIGAPNLRFKVIRFPDADTLQATMVDQLAEGAGPDIVYTNAEWIAHNPAKLTSAKTDEGFTAENFKNTFVQSATETLITDTGDILGVPMAVDTLALLFNDEHITDRLPDRNTPGRTWDVLREDAATLTKKDNSFERFAVSGLALGRVDNLNYGPQILENLMLQSGVVFFDPSGSQAIFDVAESVLAGGRKVNLGVEALKYFTSFADTRYKNHSWNAYLADADTEGKDLETFITGKTSMAFAYARDLPRLQGLKQALEAEGKKTIAEENIRVAFLPQTDDPQVSPSRKVVAEVSALAVSRNTKYPDTAWRFLKFAIAKDNLQKWFEETVLPSPRVDLLVEQEQQPIIGTYVRQAKFARANLMPVPKSSFYSALAPYLQMVNNGQLPEEKALDTAAADLSAQRQAFLQRTQALGL